MSEVVRFKPREMTVRTTGKGYPQCYHLGQTNIDIAKRELCCEECGAVLDAYDWLHSWATRKALADRESDTKDGLFEKIATFVSSRKGTVSLSPGGLRVSFDFNGKKTTRTSGSINAIRVDQVLDQIEYEFQWLERKKPPSTGDPCESGGGLVVDLRTDAKGLDLDRECPQPTAEGR